MDPVAERIEAIIEEKGYTHSAFAKAIGVQRANISHMLSGRNRPSLELVQRILSTFPELDSERLLLGAPARKDQMAKEEEEKEDIFPEKPSNKRIERVVVCYRDGTFASYEPDG